MKIIEIYWRKASHFEEEFLAPAIWNFLKNHWCAEQQTLNSLAKENNTT